MTFICARCRRSWPDLAGIIACWKSHGPMIRRKKGGETSEAQHRPH